MILSPSPVHLGSFRQVCCLAFCADYLIESKTLLAGVMYTQVTSSDFLPNITLIFLAGMLQGAIFEVI